jgi:transcriptional regulator with XRE-family HTH domain
MDSPTIEQVASHLAELRRVMGMDLPTLATRAGLDLQLVAEIEAGDRAWTLDELLAIAFGLGVTIRSGSLGRRRTCTSRRAPPSPWSR